MRIDIHTHCKFCREPHPRLDVALPAAHVEVVRCGLCRMPFVSARYDDRAAIELYDRVLSSDDDYDAFEPARSPRFLRLLDAVLPETRLDGWSVLDVGAGGGGFLHLARRHGADVSGIELSSAARRFAERVHGIELSAAPLDDPSWDGRRFGAIVIWDLLEHLPDPRRVIERAASLLEPGGRLALTTPAREGLFHLSAMGLARASRGRVTFLARHRYNMLHLQIFRSADLRFLLERAGLTVRLLERIADFSYPGSWYLRTAQLPGPLAAPLGWLADRALERVPPRNKLLAVARRT